MAIGFKVPKNSYMGHRKRVDAITKGFKQGGGARPPKPPAAGKPVLGKPEAPTKAAPISKSRAPDSIYQGSVDRATRQEESRLGQLDASEQAIKHEFGIEDPTNPFSRAEGLKRAFLARQKAASASLAAQGQGYSGAHERALSRTRREEEEARSELRRTYEGAINQIGAEKAGVKFATEEQRDQAFEDWLARTPDSEASAPPGLSPGGSGVVTPLKETTDRGEPGNFTPGGGLGNERSNSGALTVRGEGSIKDDKRLQELRAMLRQAKAAGKKDRVQVIQNRIKVVKRR